MNTHIKYIVDAVAPTTEELNVVRSFSDEKAAAYIVDMLRKTKDKLSLETLDKEYWEKEARSLRAFGSEVFQARELKASLRLFLAEGEKGE